MKYTYQLLILIIFYSCDPAVGNKFVIQNNTESRLKVESILNFGYRNYNEKDSIHTVILNPNTQSQIIEYYEIGTARDKGNAFLEGLDTIVITSEYGTLIKNIDDRKNWEFKVLKSGLFATHEVEYKLILTDRDLE
ncbi:hypothetical protein [Leeuwenhoekiella parthenopeia]|uniref:Lipoprotein n=1 Tax=Leeuwenhoekiella parthenopeia TaxID=2890320 RepID=A0ABS8GY87_9FLAO|nr:hypothetical protein [Leeuwenhoekiella parthenopeia]MCC4214468.1 hypothetical protein [Leeuwenhoekiella parthenopeia]